MPLFDNVNTILQSIFSKNGNKSTHISNDEVLLLLRFINSQYRSDSLICIGVLISYLSSHMGPD